MLIASELAFITTAELLLTAHAPTTRTNVTNSLSGFQRFIRPSCDETHCCLLLTLSCELGCSAQAGAKQGRVRVTVQRSGSTR